MPEPRHIPPERFIKQHMLRRRRDPLLRANHVRDAHQVVVHHVGQVIRREAIGLQQHLVIHIVMRKRNVAPKLVAKCSLTLNRNLKPHHCGPALRFKRRNLRGIQLPVCAVVARRQLGRDLRLPHRLQLFGRLKAAIRMPGVQQLLHILAVDLRPLRLAVRPVWSAGIRPFVPANPEPAQRIEDHLLRGGYKPRAIRVLNAQHKLPAALPGINKIKQANVGCANVRIASR